MKREAGGQGEFSVGRIFGAATPPEARQDFWRSHAPRCAAGFLEQPRPRGAAGFLAQPRPRGASTCKKSYRFKCFLRTTP